ncbi:MAG: hypothetical protein QXK06_00425 [Candidatus Diapherotrites archaeon]
MRNEFFALAVFSLLLLGSNAFALPNCNMVFFELYNVELWEGSKETFTFAINNTGNERFYIDKVNAFDFSEGIAVQEEYWGDVVLPGEKAFATISVKADKGTEERERKAYIELSGRFLGGKRCSFSDVHGEFNVSVLKEPVHKIEPRCDGFSLTAPKEKYIEGEGTIEFFASNKTNYDAIITLESESISVSESVFQLRKGEEKKFSAFIKSDADRATLKYNVRVSDCGIPSQETRIYSAMETPIPTPTPQPFKAIEIGASASKDANGFLVTVEIHNPNSEGIIGNLEAIVPQGWTVIGEKAVLAEPLSKTISLIRIAPPKGASGTHPVQIVFSYDGIEESTKLELATGSEGFDFGGAAFAVLGSGAFLIGLIIVAIILIIMLFSSPPRQYFEPWLEAKETKK